MQENKDLTLDQHVARKLTSLYILALTAIAILSLLGQAAVQYALSNQLSSSHIINIAGRQRMLSQKICKNILVLTHDLSFADKQVYLSDLNRILPIWETNFLTLKKGIVDSASLSLNSPKLYAMMDDIEPVFYTIYNNASFINRQLKQHPETPEDSIKPYLKTILNNERTFLEKQDKIVFQYDTEAKARVEKIRNMEFTLLGLTIAILILEGMFVFRPAARQIRQTIVMLISEQQKTRRINKELQDTYSTLNRIEKERHLQQVNEQRVRAASLIQGQEEERTRISRELHDGLGQLLTLLKINFEQLNDHSLSAEKDREVFRHGQDLIRQTIAEVRNISFNLMPSVLTDFGLGSALKLLCQQTAANTSKNIIFDEQNHLKKRPALPIETSLYRVAQEALNNAIKHSGASQISVSLFVNEEQVSLSISDNGVGFLWDEVQNRPLQTTQKSGISNMIERLRMIGGSVDIQTAIGKGTTLWVQTPFSTRSIHEQHN